MGAPGQAAGHWGTLFRRCSREGDLQGPLSWLMFFWKVLWEERSMESSQTDLPGVSVWLSPVGTDTLTPSLVA